MKRMPRMAALFFLGAMLVVAGCTDETERVLLPPVAPMEGITTIAVVGISNATIDPGIGLLFEQMVTSQLAESNRYTVIDGFTARAALARLNMTLEELANPEAARRLGRALGADALITGTATYYFEDVRTGVPECFNCNVEGRTPYWSVRQTTQVITSFQARVIRTDTGVIIWSNVGDGRENSTRTTQINWRSSTPPHESLVPRPDRIDIPKTREAATRNAARDFTEDLLPRWVRVRKDS